MQEPMNARALLAVAFDSTMRNTQTQPQTVRATSHPGTGAMKTLARHRFAFIQVFDRIAALYCLSPTLTCRGRGDIKRDCGIVEKTFSTGSFHRATPALLGVEVAESRMERESFQLRAVAHLPSDLAKKVALTN